ncbi:MAG: bifunctional 4-hydroxy-2-oxoglutarate aldolase/2-dehydro-3-deoxy-phosphogluconate aldolase [Rhodobacteraceae bacterium]|nr:bifunctional 4-hydroxy-2-oxoglutarate aldolase/2-dehydro-3-deoxy-phosphogluconate aldolase [Paracoccaceae bacterium]
MTPEQASSWILRKCSNAPVITTLTVNGLEGIEQLGQALVDAGLPIIEVLLRTEFALDAISALSSLPGCEVAAGSVLSSQQLHDAKACGARFAVSPGATTALLEASTQSGMPLLPGAATASEVMRLTEHGYRFLKFFPAAAIGGAAALRALAGPFPRVLFCPTGGIHAATFEQYLLLDNVAAVGGSWLVGDRVMQERRWAEVEDAARKVAMRCAELRC